MAGQYGDGPESAARLVKVARGEPGTSAPFIMSAGPLRPQTATIQAFQPPRTRRALTGTLRAVGLSQLALILSWATTHSEGSTSSRTPRRTGW